MPVTHGVQQGSIGPAIEVQLQLKCDIQGMQLHFNFSIPLSEPRFPEYAKATRTISRLPYIICPTWSFVFRLHCPTL